MHCRRDIAFRVLGLGLLAFALSAPHMQGQTTFSGSVTDNGIPVTPGDYDPYTATGNLIIGATGPGALALDNSALYAYGRTLTFGTSATNTGNLTGTGWLQLEGASTTSFGQHGNPGGSLNFAHGTLNLTAGAIDLRGSRGGNSNEVSGTGQGGNGGSFSYSGIGGVLNGNLYAQGGDGGSLNNSMAITHGGGRGGSVSVSDGSLTIGGVVRLFGGAAGEANGNHTPSAPGGFSGTLTVANSDLTIGSLEIYGGNGADGGTSTNAGGLGRAGGVITLWSGSLSVTTTFSAHGGRGGNAPFSGRHGGGGTGGHLLIWSGQFNMGGAVYLQGGHAGQGEANFQNPPGGGTGGTITLHGGVFNGSSEQINLRGGDGAPYYFGSQGYQRGPQGGNGGNIAVSGGEFNLQGVLFGGGGDGTSSLRETLTSGYSIAGHGGHGGQITLTGGLLTLAAPGASISLTGGNGGYIGGSFSGYGGDGGNGGNINLNGGTFLFSQGSINLSAGNGGSGNAQYGANGTHGTFSVAGGTLVTTTPGFLDSNLTGNLALNSGVIRFTGTGGTIGAGSKLATALTGGLGSGRTLEFDHAVTFGADLTVNSSGRLLFHDDATVAAGTVLMLNSGAILGFYLGQIASSTLFIADGATFAGPAAGTVTFDFHDLGDFAAGTYDLIDASSAGAIRNNWLASNFAVGTGIAGYTYSFAINGDVLQVTATAVPEPATYAALAGALALGIALWRRRRRAA